MTLPKVLNAEYPTPEEMLNQLLTTYRYAYERGPGIEVNVSKDTEPYKRYRPIADLGSIAVSNNKLALADISPLDAQEEKLLELAAVWGITPRPASAAAGPGAIGVVGSGLVTIPQGFAATAPNGIRYQTIVAQTLADGDIVEVVALSSGSGTNQVAGTILTWESAAIGGLKQTFSVAAGDIDGGNDADTVEVVRKRLLNRLAFPEVGGNDAQVASFAEGATAAVEAAFVYPAVRGPASYDVAVTVAGGDRALSNANQAIAASNVLANMPGCADLNLTSVSQQQVDVVLDGDLPLPVSAGGAGGGFRNARPWPSNLETGGGVLAKVTSTANLLSLKQFTVNSTSADPPYIGARFGIWDPTTHAMAEFAVLTVGGGSGAYVVTIDTQQSDAISFITAGMYVSAGAVSLKKYAADFYAAVLTLGPGEKTSSTDILPRGRRRPSPSVRWPKDLTAVVVKQVLDANSEFNDLLYAARYDTGTTTTRTSPSLPLTTADPPRILTLKHLSIRAKLQQ